jgi:hypothetical protein
VPASPTIFCGMQADSRRTTLFREPTGDGETEQELHQPCPPKHRSIAFVELITTAALAVSTAIAATAVSIGIARAEAIGSVDASRSAPLALALFIVLLLSTTAGLAAAAGHSRRA